MSRRKQARPIKVHEDDDDDNNNSNNDGKNIGRKKVIKNVVDNNINNNQIDNLNVQQTLISDHHHRHADDDDNENGGGENANTDIDKDEDVEDKLKFSDNLNKIENNQLKCEVQQSEIDNITIKSDIKLVPDEYENISTTTTTTLETFSTSSSISYPVSLMLQHQHQNSINLDKIKTIDKQQIKFNDCDNERTKKNANVQNENANNIGKLTLEKFEPKWENIPKQTYEKNINRYDDSDGNRAYEREHNHINTENDDGRSSSNHTILEAIKQTKLAITQIASNALANGINTETALKDLAMLQSSLYSLQHQQSMQMRIIQDLQSKLKTQNNKSNELPPSIEHHTYEHNLQHQHHQSIKLHQDYNERKIVEGHSIQNCFEGITNNNTSKANSFVANREQTSINLSRSTNQHSSDEVKIDYKNLNTINTTSLSSHPTAITTYTTKTNSTTTTTSTITTSTSSIIEKSKSYDRIPSPMRAPMCHISTSLASTIITDHDELPPSMNEPNTLEMLQRRAQEVLDSASQGILSGNLVDEIAFRQDKLNAIADAKNGRGEPLFKHRCRYCGKIFGSDSALQIHVRSHTGERPFKCNVCGSRFTTKGNLKVHFTRHTQKFPHIEMNAIPIPEHYDHYHFPFPMAAAPFSTNDNTQNKFDPNSFLIPSQYTHSGMPCYRPPENILKQSTTKTVTDNEDRSSIEQHELPTFFKFFPPTKIDSENDLIRQNQENPADLSLSHRRTTDSSIRSEDVRERLVKRNSFAPLEESTRKNNTTSRYDDHRSNNVKDFGNTPTSLINEVSSSDDEEDCNHKIIFNNSIDSLNEIEQPTNLSSKAANIETKHCHSHTSTKTTLSSSSSSPPPTTTTTAGTSEIIHINSNNKILDEPNPNPISLRSNNNGSTDSSWDNLNELKSQTTSTTTENLQLPSETIKLQQFVTDTIENKLIDCSNHCSMCNRNLSCRSALQQHYRTHTGERPFRCQICGRAFTTKGNLKTHMTVHQIKPAMRNLHQCTVCHRRYTNAIVLQQHIRTHSGEQMELTLDQIRALEIRDFIPLPPGYFQSIGLNRYGNLGKTQNVDDCESLTSSLNLDDDNNVDDDFQNENIDIDKIEFKDDKRNNNNVNEILSSKTEFKTMNCTSKESVENQSKPLKMIEANFIKKTEQKQNDIKNGQTENCNNQHKSDYSIEQNNISDTKSIINIDDDDDVVDDEKYPIFPINNKLTTSPKILYPINELHEDRSISQPNLSNNDVINNSNGHNHQTLIPIENSNHIHSIHKTSHSPSPSIASFNHSSMQNSTNETTTASSINHQMINYFHRNHFIENRFPHPSFVGHRYPAPGHPFLSEFIPGFRGNTTCNICYKTFACHSALEIHYRSHTKERPFKCNLCDRGFSTKGNMKQHMLTHKIRDMSSNALLYGHSANLQSSPSSDSGQSHISHTSKDNNHQYHHTHNNNNDYNNHHIHHNKNYNTIIRPQSNSPKYIEYHNEELTENDKNTKEEEDYNDDDGHNDIEINNKYVDDHGMKRSQQSNDMHNLTNKKLLISENEIKVSSHIKDCQSKDKMVLNNSKELEINSFQNVSPTQMEIPNNYLSTTRLAQENVDNKNTNNETFQLSSPIFNSTIGLVNNDQIKNISVTICKDKGETIVNNNNDIKSSITNITSEKYYCKICKKNFSSTSALQIHFRIHTGSKPFRCSICDKHFSTKGNLKVHMSIHMWSSTRISRRGRRMSLETLPLIRPHLIGNSIKNSEYLGKYMNSYHMKSNVNN